jgi:Na+-driven multidrug efflux pump
MLIFVDKIDTAIIAEGVAFLKTVSPFFCFIGLKLVFDGVLKGTGSMKLFMVVTFTDLILRVILAFVFAPIWGYEGIWYSWPVGWTTATVLSLIFYKGLSKKLKEKTE